MRHARKTPPNRWGRRKTENRKKKLSLSLSLSLCLTRADDGPGRQLRQRRHPRRADQRVAHVLPRQVARQHRPLRQVGRDVLHRVDRDVDAAVEQRVVDLLGEEALAADVGEGLAEDLVARGLDDADLEGAVLREVGEGGLVERKESRSFFFFLGGGSRL